MRLPSGAGRGSANHSPRVARFEPIPNCKSGTSSAIPTPTPHPSACPTNPNKDLPVHPRCRPMCTVLGRPISLNMTPDRALLVQLLPPLP